MTWRGEISPKCRWGARREVPLTAGRSRCSRIGVGVSQEGVQQGLGAWLAGVPRLRQTLGPGVSG